MEKVQRKKGKKLSKITAMHYAKLVYRSCLLIGALIYYIISRVNGWDLTFKIKDFGWEAFLFGFIWLSFFVEVVLRFFPSKIESMGCQKIFKKNYKPTGTPKKKLGAWKSVLFIGSTWLLLNAVFGVLHFTKVIDVGILFLISLVFSVCDMICILFFCPFQTWVMKNKCCGTCRIYNWDFAMMFTPLMFVPTVYTWTLLGVSLILMLRWEIGAWTHPERFSEKTNACLSCANCKEKLCQHKRQLRRFLQKNRASINAREKRLAEEKNS